MKKYRVLSNFSNKTLHEFFKDPEVKLYITQIGGGGGGGGITTDLPLTFSSTSGTPRSVELGETSIFGAPFEGHALTMGDLAGDFIGMVMVSLAGQQNLLLINKDGNYTNTISAKPVGQLDNKGEVLLSVTDSSNNQTSALRVHAGALTFGSRDAIPTLNPSIALNIQSSNQGILIPRLGDNTAITNPIEGLIIYSNNNHRFEYYTGTKWVGIDNTEPKILNEYENDAEADADVNLLSGQQYKLIGSRAVYQKP